MILSIPPVTGAPPGQAPNAAASTAPPDRQVNPAGKGPGITQQERHDPPGQQRAAERKEAAAERRAERAKSGPPADPPASTAPQGNAQAAGQADTRSRLNRSAPPPDRPESESFGRARLAAPPPDTNTEKMRALAIAAYERARTERIIEAIGTVAQSWTAPETGTAEATEEAPKAPASSLIDPVKPGPGPAPLT